MYKHPGVYVEHVPSGLLSIEAASTSTAVFIGRLPRGALVTATEGEPVFVSSSSQFARLFGALDGKGGGIADNGETPDWFGHAVTGFFANGGTKAYIVPVGATERGTDPRTAPAMAAIADPMDPLFAYYFSAASPGAWANDLVVALEMTLDDPQPLKDEYTVSVGYKSGAKMEAIERIGGMVLDKDSGRFLVSKIKDGSEILTVTRQAIATAGGTLSATAGLPLSYDPATIAAGSKLVLAFGSGDVTVTFAGGEATMAAVAALIEDTVRAAAGTAEDKKNFIVQVSRDNRLLLIPGLAGSTSTVAAKSGGVAGTLGLDPTQVITGKATDFTGLAGKTVDVKAGTAAVKTVTFGTPADLQAVAAEIRAGAPKATVDVMADGRLLLRVDGDTAPIAINGGTGLDLLGLTGLDASAGRPSTMAYPQPFSGTVAEARLIGGVDAYEPKTSHYADALKRLEDYRDISIVLLPGKVWDGTGNEVIDAAVTHSEFMQNRMVVVDPPNSVGGNKLVTPKDVKDLGAPTSPYAALYYPWLTVANPHYDKDVAANKPKSFDIPPSAFAAGLWARIDGSRGVWKAPAGLEATVRGTQGPNVLIGNDVQDNLNEFGVNCIRAIIGPSVVWGARTLATKVKPEFRYVPVRRTQSMIGESLYNALQAVVFEPNDHKLWASLRGSTRDFMDGLFRSGAFQGEKASDAFFVRCGLDATMTQGDIDAGIVRVVVGFAPLKPAEFVVVQIQQIVGQRG